MLAAEHHAVVTYRNAQWARVRVRGLLHNAALGEFLSEQCGEPIEVRAGTGTVKVPLAAGRNEAYWLKAISQALEARSGEREPRRAARPAPAKSDGSRRRALGASEPVTRRSAHASAAHAERLKNLLQRVGNAAPLSLDQGLSTAEAAARRKRDGANEIADVAGRSPLEILLDQFRSVPIALLGASAALALGTRAYLDAAAIGAVLAANGGIGFITEREAEETVSSLRRLRPNAATVLRGREAVTLDAREVVVGDVLLLQPGEPVAADARVVQAHRLAANEAALTGESLPSRKEPVDRLSAGTPIGERRNMVFLGTVVSGGSGRAVVVATAERTELGHIRQLAQDAQAPGTRLQRELDLLGRRLAIATGVICLGVFGIGALRGRPLLPLLRTAIALGVAAIPEGLPAVATTLLASSIRTLQARQIYARRLDAIENLGAVDTVCFDKTGTLSENRMSVASLTIGRELIVLAEPVRKLPLPDAWLRVAALCNSVERSNGDAKGRKNGSKSGSDSGDSSGSWQGSSTEVALLEFAIAQGADMKRLRRSHPTLGVRHRSEHHPYMVTLHDSATSGLLVAVKGRPDEVLARCDSWFDGQRSAPISPSVRRELLKLDEQMAARGDRVLALAFRQHPDRHFGETAGLSWLGMVGMADPLRQGLPDMMRRFRAAGIRPLMITGDQLRTAQTVAERIGLNGEQTMVDAARLPESAAQIADVAERASGFARTNPAMKLEIVRALQQRGHVVAMTGDGINDGPALKIADVGVAMGASGTDFAHAMSDLLLRDDHPAALLPAIEQGRTAFVNVRKAVRYLVATNLSEVAATTIAVLAGMPEPFDPLALLWTNIATDVWPAIALGLEPAEPRILERPPVSLNDGLLERREWRMLATDAATMTLAALASFGYGLARYGPGAKARTLAFTTLTSSQLLYAFAMRSPLPLRAGGLQPNPMLRRAVLWSLLAQAGTVLLPFARRVLHTTPLGALDTLVVASTAVMPLLTRELIKERQR